MPNCLYLDTCLCLGSPLLKYEISNSYANEMSLDCITSLTPQPKFAKTKILKIRVKRLMTVGYHSMTEMQNPYKLPLNPELTMFSEKPDESTNNVIIGYQYRFEHKV
jgi:hypothetical protein